MKFAFFLFFWPTKLASLASADGQKYDNALASIKKIRKSYFLALRTISLLVLIALGVAYVVNYLGGLSIQDLVILRFVSSALIALAVLAKLSWEIQTWKGVTIPEQANSFLFQFFYKIGVVGMLSSLVIST